MAPIPVAASSLNSAAYDGGGIYNASDLTVMNGFLNLNTAPDNSGGGIYNDSSAADVSMMGNRIFGNTEDNCAPAASVEGCSG